MFFEIIGDITDIETIASGPGIREIKRLRKQFGQGRWRKRKGVGKRQIAQWQDKES